MFLAGSTLCVVSGGHFGVVIACVVLSRGLLLFVFSLFFVASSFLRLCVGVSMSMPSSGPKQARKVSSVILLVRVGNCAGSVWCCRRCCTKLAALVCSATTSAPSTSNRALLLCILSLGLSWWLPRRIRGEMFPACLGAVAASLSELSTTTLVGHRVHVDACFAPVSGP